MASLIALELVVHLMLESIKKAQDLYGTQLRNKAMAAELRQFTKDMEQNTEQLRKRIETSRCENKIVGPALDALCEELKNARDEVEGIVIQMKKASFLSNYRRANDTCRRMQSIRERVLTSFQTKMSFLTLDVNLENKKTLDELKTYLSSLSENWRQDYSEAVNPMLDLQHREEASERHRRNESDMELQRSFQESDVVADRQQRSASSSANPVFGHPEPSKNTATVHGPHEWYQDPITGNTMCDPVNASDGRTYDRWSILEQPGLDQSLHILGDNEEIRELIIEQFPEEEFEEKIMVRRSAYRSKALQKSRDALQKYGGGGGSHEEAIKMLSQVLEWDDEDKECLELQNRMLKLHHNPVYPCGSETRGDATSSIGIFTPSENYKIVENEDVHSHYFQRRNSAPPFWKLVQNPYLDQWASFHDRTREPVVLSADGLHIEFQYAPVWWTNTVVAFQANKAVDSSTADIFYFELTVESHGRPHTGCVAIGFWDENFLPHQLPGTCKNSCAYHSDTGKVVCTTDPLILEDVNEEEGEMNTTFSDGDVVGAGIDHRSSIIFFVKNGRMVKETQKLLGVIPSGKKLFPVVGMSAPRKKLRLNFGQRSFKYDALS